MNRFCFPRVPLAVPYWNGATYRAIFHCLRSGTIIDGFEVEKLRASLCQALGAASVVLCGSGSLALQMALRALGMKQGDEVVVPAFCCSAVVAPILAAGAVPVLGDVGVELNLTAETAEAALTANTRAIIVPHLFGNPAEMDAIIELARRRNIRVIDDAAQALGACMNERPVGAYGDAAIISFGREKICFGLGGGALILPNNELAARAANMSLPSPENAALLRTLLTAQLWHRWRRWSLPVERAFCSRPGPDIPAEPYRNEAMANLQAAVAGSLMETLQENIKARRARVRAYVELLGGDERLQLVAHRDGSACLTQVVRVLPLRRKEDLAVKLVDALNNGGYEVQGSYVPIHLLPGHERWKRDRLPHTDGVWADLIELPCEPHVQLSHIERIAAIIKETLDS
jgi:dTDP-4-amino-4,6-dideoxygalactose transaminase